MRGWAFTARCLLVAVVLTLVWLVAVEWCVPAIIRAVHSGEGFGFLAGLFEGRGAYPVEDYLGDWHDLARRIGRAIALLGAILYLLALFRVPARLKPRLEMVSRLERDGRGRQQLGLWELFVAASALGLATGWTEAAYLGFKRFVKLEIVPSFRFIDLDILWMPPLADLLLFVGVAMVIAAGGAFIPRVRSRRIVLYGLLLLALTALLRLPGWLHWLSALLLALGASHVISRPAAVLWDRYVGTLSWVTIGLAAFVPVVGITVHAADRKASSEWIEALPDAAPGAPDVLLVVFDAVRAQNSSLYGYGRRTSPGLERLGQEGVVFERAFAPESWSLPSHATMLTGRYNLQLGTGPLSRLDGTYRTLAEELSARGYGTFASIANNAFGSPVFGLDRGFARYRVQPVSFGTLFSSSWYFRMYVPRLLALFGNHRNVTRKRAARVNAEMLEFVDEEPDRPFFALLNYFDAHEPYRPPDPFLQRYHPEPRYWHPSGTELSREEIDELMAAYDGAIAYMDHELDRLLDALAERGRLDRTLLIVTSDHGESFMEHGIRDHGSTLYVQELHVPLLVRFPGRVPAGVRISPAVGLRDIPATVVDLVDGVDGNDSHPIFPGSSLARFWRGATARDSSQGVAPVFAELGRSPNYGGARRGRSIILGSYHYIQNEDGSEELYDLESDPEEHIDLGAREAHSERVAHLRELLTKVVESAARASGDTALPIDGGLRSATARPGSSR